MSKRAIYFLMLLLLLFASKVTEAQVQPDFVFNNRDDIYDGHSDSGIKPLYWNNGVLFLGFCVDSNYRYGMTITFYDTSGVLLWKKIYLNPGYWVLQGNDLLAQNDSSFYVAGDVYKDTTYQTDLMFAKFDSHGDSIFFKFYPDAGQNGLFDAAFFSADTLLLLSTWEAYDYAQYTRYFITSVDTNGNVWSLLSDTLAPVHIARQVLIDSGNIYVGGTYNTDTGWYYNVKIFIDVYDHQLNHIDTWHPTESVNEYFNDFFEWNKKFCLTSLVPIGQGYYGKIGFLNSSGTYITHVDIGPWNSDFFLLNSQVLNKNCVIIPVFQEAYQHAFYFYDSSLQLICTAPFEYSDNAEQELNSITLLPGDKIAGTGYLFAANQNQSQDHWNFLTHDIDGYLSSNCNVATSNFEELPSKQDLYKIYPTLFDEEITVECNVNSIHELNITLFNEMGQEVLHQTGFDKIILSAKTLDAGIYFLHIAAENHPVISKLIKIQQ